MTAGNLKPQTLKETHVERLGALTGCVLHGCVQPLTLPWLVGTDLLRHPTSAICRVEDSATMVPRFFLAYTAHLRHVANEKQKVCLSSRGLSPATYSYSPKS